MTSLTSLSDYQSEALVICLAASLIWAAALYFGARALGRRSPAMESVWVGALVLAVLPSLLAPMLAGLGLSLRPAPEMAPALEYVAYDSITPTLTEPAALPVTAPTLSVDQMISAAAIIYIYGAMLALMIWAVRLAGFSFAISRAEPVKDAELLREVEAWGRRLEVSGLPKIRRSRHVASVCVFGAMRPVILIPDDIDVKLMRDNVVMMCAHELAHLRRGDTRLFTATALTRVLFWFNPMVKRIAACAELAAEESADALVLKAGADRRAYAACFIQGLKYAAKKLNAQPVLTPSFAPVDRSGRRRRLQSILSGGARRPTSSAMRIGVTAVAGIAALLAFGQAALAVDPESAAERKRDYADKTPANNAMAKPGKYAKSDEWGPAALPNTTEKALLDKVPVDGDISLGFGEKAKINGKKNATPHKGVDIKAPKGTPVAAAGDGVVVDAASRYQNKPDYGKVVVIDHGHGTLTRYAHLDSFAVKRGDRVKAGDIIGAVGETGLVTGPHLHFETLQDGAAVDPVAAIGGRPPAPPVAPAAASSAPLADPVAAPKPAPAAKPDAARKTIKTTKILPSKKAAQVFVVDSQEPASDEMVDSLEDMLLGRDDADAPSSYSISFTLDDKIYKFTGDRPLTTDQRAEIQHKLKKIRLDLKNMRKIQEKAQKEGRQRYDALDTQYRETEAEGLDMHDFALAWAADDIEPAMTAESLLALAERERAIAEARRDLDEASRDSIEEALDDLADAEADIYESDLTPAQRTDAKRALKQARANLERSLIDHQRALEQARKNLDAQQAEIERMRADLHKKSKL